MRSVDVRIDGCEVWLFYQVEDVKPEVVNLQPDPMLFRQRTFRIGYAEPQEERTPMGAMADAIL